MERNDPDAVPKVLNKAGAKSPSRIVRFLDGPAEGKTREIEEDGPAPDNVGILDDAEPELTHWYRVFDYKAYFDHSERGGP
jgi:hypothetical protein